MDVRPRIGRRLAAGAAGALALGLAGVLVVVGYARPVLPTLAAPASPLSFHRIALAPAGVSLAAPVNWLASPGQGDLRLVISSGPAVIALWRYPGVPVPGDPRVAERSLLARVRRRDPSFHLLAAGLARLGRAPAVILDGLETIRGQRRRVRSEHIYTGGGEVVLETYAPVPLFKRLDHAVLSPVRRSLRLLTPARP